MEHRDRFPKLTVETAAPAAQPLIAASTKSFGFLPTPVARASSSPALLKHLLAGFAAFEHSSLPALEREVVALTVAHEQACHYCMSMHSAVLSGTPDAAVLPALRTGQPLAAPRLEALRQLVLSLVRDRGRISETRWQAAEQAGFSTEQLLDTVLGTGVYLLSTMTNTVTNAELDPAFEPFRWEPAEH